MGRAKRKSQAAGAEATKKTKRPALDKAVLDLAADSEFQAMADHARRWEQVEDVVRDTTQSLRAERGRLVSKGALSATEFQRFDQLQSKITTLTRNVLRQHGSIEEPESILNAFTVRTDCTLTELVTLMDSVDVNLLERTSVVFGQLCDQAWTRALDLCDDDPSLPELPNRPDDHRSTWELVRMWCVRAERLREDHEDANAPYIPDRLGKAILEVLDSSDVLLTRDKIAFHLQRKKVRSDPKPIRERVNDLMSHRFLAEPKRKGRGLRITDAGRRYLGSARTVDRQNP